MCEGLYLPTIAGLINKILVFVLMHLRLSSCSPEFESQPHHQCFMNTHLIWKLHKSWSNGVHTISASWKHSLYLAGSITVQMTSYLFCLDSAALLLLILHQLYLFGRIQNQSAVQRYFPLLWVFSVFGKCVHRLNKIVNLLAFNIPSSCSFVS